MKKMLVLILFILGILILVCAGYLFIGEAKPAEKIIWGVNFSQKHTENLGLDWKETYLALIDELGVKNLKLITHWDLIEPKEGEYNFEDLDWQIEKAKEKGVKILLVLGIKTGRWPECHQPLWVQFQNSLPASSQENLLNYIEKIVDRYKDSEVIWAWQVENEPFFPFGECPKFDKELLQKEINLVKLLDYKKRPIVISDSGEGSWWIRTASLGDVVGITMYEKVWFTLPSFSEKNLEGFKEGGFYLRYHFPPVFYWRKSQIIKKLFGKEVICVELQAEPWGKVLLYDLSLEEQKKTMNLEQFQKNIEFAKKTGLKEFYLWGAEWWYWFKIKQSDSVIWDEAKKLFY